MVKKCLILIFLTLFFLMSCGNSSTDSKDASKQQEPVQPPPAAPKSEPSINPAAASEPSDTQRIKWYGYNEGMSLGKSLNKKILLTFYADWCRYCTEMDLKTFSNRDIISYLNEHFISIRVNSEKEIKTATLYNVRGIPVTWFIGESGENIGSQPGFISPEAMLPLLKYIYTDSYKTMKYADFLNKM